MKNQKKHSPKNALTVLSQMHLNPREFTQTATIPANVYASFSSLAENFIDFLRHANALLESQIDSVVESIKMQSFKILKADTSDEEAEEIREVLTWKSHEQFISELILSRLSENYIIYLTDLANHIFRTNPKTLKSNKTETREFILDHSDIDGLISSIADKETEKLNSFHKLKDCFQESFGLSLYSSQNEMDLAEEIIAIRNLIVHKQGIVDNKFMQRFPNYKLLDSIKVDQDVACVDLKLSEVQKYGSFLAKSVAQIDNKASVKFKLPVYYMVGVDIPDKEN